MDKIDFTPLEKAIKSLDEIIERYNRESYDDAIRDAMIKRFEYTYSLSLRFLNRFLKQMLPEIEDNLTFNEIIRESNRFGLLKTNLEEWTLYKQKRNMSSDTYDEDEAKSLVVVIHNFKDEAHYLLEKIKKRFLINL